MEKEDKDADGGGAVAAAVPVDKTAPPSPQAKKKPSSSPSFLQAASLWIRRYTSCTKPGFDAAGTNSPVAQDDVDGSASDMLKSIVDGIRPLHVQPEYLRRPLQPPPLPTGYESFHDVCLPPPSPDDARSSDENMSRYASAEDLQALDADGSNDDDAVAREGGAADGNNSVDVMAEEFIAKFYEQMRLQRLESIIRSGADQTATPTAE